MISRVRLAAVMSVAVLLVTACSVAGGLQSAPVDAGASTLGRPEATLTAETYETAAARVTETVEAASQLAQETNRAVQLTATVTLGGEATPGHLAPDSASDGPTPTSVMPVISEFRCDPCVVEPGQAADLSWDVTGATAVTLDGRGVVAPGSMTVVPDQTTTYRMVAVNGNGQSERTVTVEVRGLPVIYFFTCLPCEVFRGESSSLGWDLSGGTAAYLDGEGVTAPGSTMVAPDQTTTYRLVAVSDRGSVERLVTVTVKEGGDPEAVSNALTQMGYQVRSVGYLPLAAGNSTISVVMAAVAADEVRSLAVSDQYFWGLRALYQNYPDQMLSVGLYDGVRYTTFVTVKPATFEALLRGEVDGTTLWRAATWNAWDEWSGRWLPREGSRFPQQDFVSKDFTR